MPNLPRSSKSSHSFSCPESGLHIYIIHMLDIDTLPTPDHCHITTFSNGRTLTHSHPPFVGTVPARVRFLGGSEMLALRLHLPLQLQQLSVGQDAGLTNDKQRISSQHCYVSILQLCASSDLEASQQVSQGSEGSRLILGHGLIRELPHVWVRSSSRSSAPPFVGGRRPFRNHGCSTFADFPVPNSRSQWRIGVVSGEHV